MFGLIQSQYGNNTLKIPASAKMPAERYPPEHHIHRGQVLDMNSRPRESLPLVGLQVRVNKSVKTCRY